MGVDNEDGAPKGAEEFKAPEDKPGRKPTVIEQMEDMDRADAGLPPLDRSKPKAPHGETIINKMEKLDKE